jgi:hypothetical protein
MMLASGVRHPWPCLWFVGSLWLLYEVGLWRLSAQGQAANRCGVDLWLRWLSEQCGLPALSIVPALALVLLAGSSFLRWKERPVSTPAALLALFVESLIAALLLWWVSRNFDMFCQRAGIALTVPGVSFSQFLTFLGAGVYEEIVFRFGLFGGMVLLLRLLFFPRFLAIPLAAIASALLFALAHHVGPWGEPWRRDYFLFRAAAGLYFTALYLFRGLGVAVGAHAAYDLLIGLSQQPAG